MIYKKIILDDNNPNVFLEVFATEKIENIDYVRNAILVIPGGGYGCVCSDREGEPIATAFMAQGYNAFVLHYSVGRTKTFPTQLIEASKAMKHIKDNAEEYNIDPNRVFVTGFSAGGHLAASLGIMWNTKEIYDELDMPYGYNKPAGMILAYPVISGVHYPHMGSMQNLLADDAPSKEDLEKVSVELHVSSESAPLFVMHTSNDSLVDVRNSLRLAEVYKENGMTFELHIYPDAPHGLALSNPITCGNCTWKDFNQKHMAKWINEACEWAEQI